MKPASTEPKGSSPASADKPPASLGYVPLNKIGGVHTSLEHMCGIYFIQKSIFKESNQKDVQWTLLFQPLAVLKSGGKYTCLSSPSSYAALCQIYPPETQVLCVVVDAADVKCDMDELLKQNSELKTVLAIGRMAHRSLRRKMGRLINNLSDPAKCLLGGGRKSLRAICKNLKLSPNTFTTRGKPALDADAAEHDHDLKTPVDRSKKEWSASSE